MSGQAAGGQPTAMRTSALVSMAVALALVGFVAAIQWKGSPERRAYTTSAQQTLSALVVRLENEQAHLLADLEAAQTEIQSFEEGDSGSASAQAEVSERLAEVRAAAGLSELAGPGVIIEIADSTRTVPPGGSAVNYLVLADDLRDIVVALWHAGADGIAINGERLVPTSSIYGVGSSILVNTAFLSPPFRIEAVGPPDLAAQVQVEPAFVARVGQRIEAYGIQFAIQSGDALVLPAFVGSTSFRWAVPGAEPE